MAGYIGSKAVITSGVSASIDELNIIDGVTATTAELNTLDGVTAVVGELNALDIGSTAVGTAVASKAVILDSNKDYTGLRNVTATGAVTGGSVVVADGGNIGAASDTDSIAIASNGVVTFSQAPVFPDGSLNLADLDIDGGTDIGAALVDADLMIVDDGAGGTNRKSTLARLATYMGTKVGGGMEFIASSGELSSAASASFTGFDASKYDSYVFNLYYVKPATNNQSLLAHASVNGGTSYDTTDGNYHYNNASDYTAFAINQQYTAGSGSGEYGIMGSLKILKPHATAHTVAFANVGTHQSSAGVNRGHSSDSYKYTEYLSTTAVNAIQFKFGSGNIASGEITMFGIVNA